MLNDSQQRKAMLLSWLMVMLAQTAYIEAYRGWQPIVELQEDENDVLRVDSPSVCAAASRTSGTEIHVDVVEGDNTYPGTTNRPKASLGAAVTLAASESASNPEIVLHAGLYHENVSVSNINNLLIRAATAKVVAVDCTSPFQPCTARNRRTSHTESHREWHLLATDRGSVVYTIDDLKTNRDAQITVGSIVFFLLAFPIYFGMAAGNADGSLGGGVADYQVNGEITYLLLDSGTESIADGETWPMTYNTDGVNNAEDLNIVGVRISMSYGEDETSSGLGCVVTGGNPEADTITGTANHLEFTGSADGQNNGGSGSHEAMATWYNESMVGAVVSGLSMDEIKAQIDSMGAGLGDHSVSISVDAQAGGGPGCAHNDGGETVDYTVELMVLEYTIAPYIDTSDI